MNTKNYRVLECKSKDRFFKIEEDLPDVGWYLKVFDKNMNCIADHLQNDLNAIIEFCLDEYGIEKNKWTEKL